MPQGCWLASFDKIYDCNELKSIHISPIILANFSRVKMHNQQLHDRHTQSPISATILFPKTSISPIKLNIMNSQHNPSRMIMTDVIIK